MHFPLAGAALLWFEGLTRVIDIRHERRILVEANKKNVGVQRKCQVNWSVKMSVGSIFLQGNFLFQGFSHG
jgi:hypothetical protein